MHLSGQRCPLPAERRVTGLVGLVVAAWSVAACRSDRESTAQSAAAGQAAEGTSGVARTDPNGDAPVLMTMRGVRLRMGQGIVLDVERLQGRMISRQRGQPPVFDEQDSYTLAVDAAE